MPSPLKKSFAAEQLEKRKKKKPSKIIVVAVIVAVVAVGYAMYMRFGIKEIPTETLAPTTGEKPSIAVLPFVNMSTDPEQVPFCDGISDAILNALTHVGDLRVIARSSSFQFRGDAVDLREVGEKLNAKWVLEGSVQKAGSELRIMAQLINVADLSHLFSNAYEREFKDVFAIQEEIAKAVVDSLKINLLDSEKAAIEKRHTENVEANELFMKGKYYAARNDGSTAIDYYQQAVEKDPNFAKAFAELAFEYATGGRSDPVLAKSYNTKSKKALDRALKLDDTLPGTYTALAMINMGNERDWKAAEYNFKKAIEINPNYENSYSQIDDLLIMLGKEQEALDLLRKALENNPRALEFSGTIISILAYVGEYEEAIQICQKMVEIDPKFHGRHLRAGTIYRAQGKYEEAIEEYKKGAQLYEDSRHIPPTSYDAFIGLTFGLMGNREEAEKILAEVQGNVMYENWVRIGLKDFDPIFKMLDNLYNDRNQNLIWLLSQYKRMSKDIVTHPRWKELMRKLDLPED
ncbi:tetratricopeptide repeat protein [Candidatus Latescibacterota bacterium]